MKNFPNYEIILFDLDGTLTDSCDGIINSVMYALDSLGIKVNDRKELYSFIGPPLADEFKRKFGFSEEMCQKAISIFREYFTEKGIFENLPYDRIEDVLSQLKEAGYILAIATSKPEPFAVRIAEHFDLTKYFSLIAGSELNGTRLNKTDVISYALKRLKAEVLPSNTVLEKSKILMIGDRYHDIDGAKKNGIASMGVLYGYGTKEELLNAGADLIAENVQDIKLILQRS